MWIFSCPCCVCPGGGVCWEGLVGLLKLSQPGKYWQAWKILASLENTGKPGKYWQAVSEAVRCWGMFWKKNNSGAAGLCRYPDFRITPLSLTANICLWYNIDNERREKLYNMTESHQSPEICAVQRFSSLGYKIPSSRQKRFTANLHKIW